MTQRLHASHLLAAEQMEYVQANRIHTLATQAMQQVMQSIDVCVTPTSCAFCC